ncbi:aminodeoxychorismate synthase [Sanguibacter keddieii]|uniref:aminodeoxychorismate synthase n=1 Tax=Sanguibacter keddieii TaxID=60920 RepID=UPI00065FEB7A|nr:aminodeoxychorismate synthase [Sanguibacter keddieii]
MSALTWQDARGGVGLRVTVPVAMSPDQAARDLAPRLSALAGERAPASSDGEPARAQRAVPVVTIDGYSGSGKSTLAAALARLVAGWQVLHLDDWYPGWDGLEAGVGIARRIAADLRAGRASSYEAWDWENGTTGATIRVPLAPTIIEGCGAIEAEADLVIWIADPGEDERRHRALARDGQTYAPHWQRWADQDLGRSLP